MSSTDVDSAVASALDSSFQGGSNEFSVPSASLDSPDGKENGWQMSDWAENLGYYKKIPELRTAVDAKAKWVVGGGFEAEPETNLILMAIVGNGKDSFNSILKNMQIVKTVAGDSFAEVIRDDNEVLANLKPLDPSTIKIFQNDKGRIIRYEQHIKNRPVKKFLPEEIFHLSRDRIADEIHGTSIIPAVKWIIDARNEAMSDWKKVLHRNVAPMYIYHLDTDDTVKIAAFKTKMDGARADGENLYVPKGVVEPEIVVTASNQSLNPLAWIEKLNDYFYQVVNVPQIIVGNAKAFTDASGKIVYLAFEQSVKDEQLYIEEQVLGQLNLEIELTFPASLQNETLAAKPDMDLEEEPIEGAAQPNDTTSEMEGKT